MYKRLNSFVLIQFALLLNGCAQATDRTLSPPLNSDWVNIEIKNPSAYTKPFPLEVLYVSTTCKRELMSMRDGQHYEKVGLNPIKIPLQEKNSSGVWIAKVARDGGGKCNWKLSEFNMGIEYIDATHLGKGLVPGTAVGATIAFDDNAAKNGLFKVSENSELVLSPAYYPLVQDNKRISENDMLNLFGEKDFMQIKMVSSAKDIQVIFKPTLDESKLVKMIAPKEHKAGAFYKIIYPDGTVVSDGTTHPDVNRLKD
ncbi:hypothetical protein FEI17_08075 [Kosakonia radicincitans]|uniref:Lipoprotein n=1 Tax=Kosakonia radicincitans TaxID=283686 RepID=A0AAX2EWU8_9ENTR|nr:hypothetical protein [Kosakonia radicincitans]MDP9568649.1 hypothetical protein [Kosakonia oryzae]QEM90601.1 hypothetical protein FEI17_08075 [Kosakonia radicincitans]SFF21502.1 hypothetical protein SAMN03159468_04217 [Kosakonia radicincitans]SFR23244.1 hypothetical protein SAMN03159514_04008 [Kosakonia radicincitans]SFU01824.1 hypothetical protein SAMN03159428_03467 [Kosakonia radicincitans]